MDRILGLRIVNPSDALREEVPITSRLIAKIRYRYLTIKLSVYESMPSNFFCLSDQVRIK